MIGYRKYILVFLGIRLGWSEVGWGGFGERRYGIVGKRLIGDFVGIQLSFAKLLGNFY
jgi:hypothetical protein